MGLLLIELVTGLWVYFFDLFMVWFGLVSLDFIKIRFGCWIWIWGLLEIRFGCWKNMKNKFSLSPQTYVFTEKK